MARHNETSTQARAFTDAGNRGSTSGFLNSGHAAGSVERTHTEVLLSWCEEMARLGRVSPLRERDPWEMWTEDAALGKRVSNQHSATLSP